MFVKIITSRLRNSKFQYSLIKRYKTANVTSVKAQWTREAKPFSEVPGPKGLPYFGNFYHYLTGGGISKVFEKEQKFYQEYGPIFKEKIFGLTIVHVMDPTECEKVYRAEGKEPSRGQMGTCWLRYRRQKGYCLGVNLSDGEGWTRYRQAIATKMLRQKEQLEYIDGFNEVVADVIKRIETLRVNHDGELPDLEGELFKWATESVGTMVFDARVGLYANPPREELLKFIQASHDFFVYMQRLETGPERLIYHYIDTPSWKKFCSTHDTLVEVGQKYVDEAMKKLEEPVREQKKARPVLSLLAHLLNNEELTPSEVNICAIDQFLAGVDTSSNTMLWLLYDMARNPGAQEELYKEVVEVVGKDGYVTAADLTRIPYLKACTKESMRINPVAYCNNRVLSEDIVLKGYNVPAGTHIQPSIYSSGRSEEYFEEPLKFKPERWLKEKRKNIHPYASLPFGAGPRMCVGRRIAELELYLLLAKIVQKFRLEYNHEPVGTINKIVTVPDRPVKIKFVDRA